MMFGIDTSNPAIGRATIDWAKVKAHGPATFAILRAMYGTSVDSTFVREFPRARAVGLTCGGYLFLRFPYKERSAPSPRDQAEAFCSAIKLEPGVDLPPVLDVEFPGDGRKDTGMTAEGLLSGVLDAYEFLAQHYGCEPIIYTSARVWRDDLKNLPAPQLAACPLWLARYPFKAGPARRDAGAFDGGRLTRLCRLRRGDAGNWSLHQFQGNAESFPGVPGLVDMNRFNVMTKAASGRRVMWLHGKLGLAPSGKMDEATMRALVSFQGQRGLVADGVVGVKTFAALCWA